MTWLKSASVLLLFTALGLAQAPSGDKCPPLSESIKQRIENYLAQRLVSGTGVRPSVKAIDPLADSCYRKITMTIPGTNGDVIMYLSPEERFLTSTLYDLSLDPQKEVARIAENVGKLLMRDESPRLAGSESRINLVEFVDFECPFCKQFADWYRGLPPPLRDQTTLIFKNLPLPQHLWARDAAAYAICANLQSPAAFHQLATFLFQSQSEITPQNLKDKVSAELRQANMLDLQQLQACVSGKDVSLILERDVSVAKQLNVNNTPTLFINGRRVLRVSSAEELQHLLEAEVASIDSSRAQSDQVSAAHGR